MEVWRWRCGGEEVEEWRGKVEVWRGKVEV